MPSNLSAANNAAISCGVALGKGGSDCAAHSGAIKHYSVVMLPLVHSGVALGAVVCNGAALSGAAPSMVVVLLSATV